MLKCTHRAGSDDWSSISDKSFTLTCFFVSVGGSVFCTYIQRSRSMTAFHWRKSLPIVYADVLHG